MRTYADLSVEAEKAWTALLRRKQYRKDEAFIREGDVPTAYAFVVQGIFYQHHVGPNGDMVIKYFFPENRIAASVSATLLGEPSLFTITAARRAICSSIFSSRTPASPLRPALPGSVSRASSPSRRSRTAPFSNM